jgi:hypothetical protein
VQPAALGQAEAAGGTGQETAPPDHDIMHGGAFVLDGHMLPLIALYFA